MVKKVATKSKSKPKPEINKASFKAPTISSYLKMLRDPDSIIGGLAFINQEVKYSAAYYGVFDFPADARFYDYLMTGKTKNARTVIINRLKTLKREGGELLIRTKLEKGKEAYAASCRKFVKNSGLNKKELQFVKRKLAYYLEPEERVPLGKAEKGPAKRKLDKPRKG